MSRAHASPSRKRLLIGLAVIGGGTLLLLNNLGIVSLFGILQFWPTVFMLLGALLLFKGGHPRRYSLPLAASLVLWLGVGMLYLLALLLFDRLQAVSRASRAEQHAAEARLQAREAELAMLRLQINPHFLFNSLNSISALTGFDAAAAREMTLSLAEFYRHTLQLAGRERVSLAEELTLCRHYLAIERFRFGERLQFDEQIAANLAAQSLPPMLLQPLLENAVKHGIQAGAGGCIHLQVEEAHGWTYLRLGNPHHPHSEAGTGTGLTNVRARLTTCYGDRAYLAAGIEAGCFVVEIRLPREE